MRLDREPFLKNLEAHVPSESLDLIWEAISPYQFALRITRERSTKHGDYRLPVRKGDPHKISVNGSLNQYAFLLTFLHEIAHMHAYAEFGRKIKPHGWEWKKAFIDLAAPFMKLGVWPDDVLFELRKYFRNPKASSSGAPDLMKVLRKYDGNSHIYLDDLEEGCIFALDHQKGRWFKKLEKRRTRVLCMELDTGRNFTIHSMAKVIRYDEQQ